MTTGAFNGDSYADVAVGIAGDTIDGHPGAGAADVILGSEYGTGNGAIQWSQDSKGIFGVAESEDFFGQAVAGRSG